MTRLLFVNNVALKAKPDVTSLALLTCQTAEEKKEPNPHRNGKVGLWGSNTLWTRNIAILPLLYQLNSSLVDKQAVNNQLVNNQQVNTIKYQPVNMVNNQSLNKQTLVNSQLVNKHSVNALNKQPVNNQPVNKRTFKLA